MKWQLTGVQIKHLGDIAEALTGVWLQPADAEYVRVAARVDCKHSLAGNVRKTAPPRRLKVVHFERRNRQLALTSAYTSRPAATGNHDCNTTDLRRLEIRFKFESDVPIRIRFESDVPIRKCRFENFESAVHATNYARSLFNKNINLCAVCSWGRVT